MSENADDLPTTPFSTIDQTLALPTVPRPPRRRRPQSTPTMIATGGTAKTVLLNAPWVRVSFAPQRANERPLTLEWNNRPGPARHRMAFPLPVPLPRPNVADYTTAIPLPGSPASRVRRSRSVAALLLATVAALLTMILWVLPSQAAAIPEDENTCAGLVGLATIIPMAVDREYPRYATSAVVTAKWDGNSVSGTTSNLSRGGMCAKFDHPIPVGTACTFDLELVFEGNNRSETLTLPARAVWCTPVNHEHQAGISFLKFGSEQREYLELFIRFLADSKPVPQEQPRDIFGD